MKLSSEPEDLQLVICYMTWQNPRYRLQIGAYSIPKGSDNRLIVFGRADEDTHVLKERSSKISFKFGTLSLAS